MGVVLVLAVLFLCFQENAKQALIDGFAVARRSVLGLMVLLLFASWFVSALVSLDVTGSLSTWFRVSVFLSFVVFIHRLFVEHSDSLDLYKKASLIVSVGVLVYIALVLMGWAALFAPIEALKTHAVNGHNFFKAHGSTAVVVLPFLIWSGWTLAGGWRYLAGFATILTGILIYSDGTEISLAGLAGIIGAIGAVGFTIAAGSVRRSVSYIFWIGASVFVIGISYYVVSALPKPPYVNQMPDLVPLVDSHRELIWSFVLEAHKAVPFFGYGPNAVNNVAGASTIIEALNQEYIPSHPHNWMIEILAETGWFGFGLLLACIALHLRQAVRGLYYDRPAALALIASSGAYWVSGLVNFSFWTSWWQSAYLLSIVATMAAIQASTQRQRNSETR